MVDLKEMKDLLWARVKSSDYEEPRNGWIPEDSSLRFDWEGPACMPNLELPKSKGKKVILKAKEGWDQAFDNGNNDI